MEGSILYEIVGCCQWVEEKEIVDQPGGCYQPDKGFNLIAKFGSGNLLKRQPTASDLSDWFSVLGPYWKFLPSPDGKVVAVLQPTVLEMRSERDNFGSLIGKCNIIRDSNLSFRRMAWNDDGSLLAVSFTNGLISMFDRTATQLFVVRLQQNASLETLSSLNFVMDHALSGLFFVEERVRKLPHPNELVTINRKGVVKGYRQVTADAMEFHHEANLRRFYPQGVISAVYSRHHCVMFVSGLPIIANSKLKAKEKHLQHGITAWRLINDHPYYRIVFTVSEQELMLDSRSLWRMAFSAISPSSKGLEDPVFRMTISPGGKLLAGIHISGAVSSWHLPSLKLNQLWPLKSQFQFNAENPSFNCNWRLAVNKTCNQQIDPWRHNPYDIAWWNNEVVIISRCNGCVSLCSVQDHVPSQNLLGDSPELFNSAVRLSSRIDKGFFALETEVKNEDGKDLSMTDMEIVTDDFWIKTLWQEVLFWLTDLERFRPPRKRKKKLPSWILTHSLLNVKSITPQELFHRKIDAEEYGEALDLARLYNLDSDLVFQRRWTKTPVTSQSIKDFLGKISKRNWVLQECLDRVPEKIDAARELLEFGLKGTEITAAVTISQGRDRGRFVMWAPDDLDVSESDYLIILDKNNLEVRRLIDYRRKLLHFLDILNTYEAMLGGPSRADGKYDSKTYTQLRSRTLLDSCILMARNSDTVSLQVLLTNHWADVQENYFEILSSFPETNSPNDYKAFLPEVSRSGSVLLWKNISAKKKDWSDDFVGMDGVAFNSSGTKYNPTVEEVQQWYTNRVTEIERLTGLTNYALDLAKLGVALNIPEMQELVEVLEIVETLVYDVKLEEMTIDKLGTLSDIEKLKLLMSKVDEDNFMHRFKYYALPFLQQCDLKTPGTRFSLLNEYLVSVAEEDLSLIVPIFEKSRKDCAEPLITSEIELLQLAQNCLYACSDNSKTELIQSILKCLPPQSYANLQSAELLTLRDAISDMEMQFSAAKILEKYGMSYSLAEIKSLSEDIDGLDKFFHKLCHYAIKRDPPLKVTEWKSLLYDVLQLQRTVFPNYEVTSCYKTYVRALLKSGSSDIINLAKNFLDQTPTEVETDDKGNLKIIRQNSTAYSTTYALYLYLIPYEESLGIVLEGAEFYFDSACAYTDPDIELAKTCLNLMDDTKEPNIILLFDLIDAMKLLNKDFALNILPQTVRKSTDKLGLLKKAMDNIPNGYKKLQQLLKMSLYLHIEEMDITEVESYVYEIAGKAGLELPERDVKFCMQVCHNIMAKNYEAGWKIFTEVAKDDSDPPIVDHETRLAFINYALNICPSEEIMEVLNAKYLIEIRRLHAVLADISPENVQDENSETPIEESPLVNDPDLIYKAKLEDLVEKTSSYTAWINPLKKMAEVVETSKKVLLSSKDHVSSLVNKSSADESNITAASPEETSNEDFARESYPLIYIDDNDGNKVHVSRLASKYNSFSDNWASAFVKARPALELSITLNQIWHLERLLLGEKEVGERDIKVVEQLVSSILPEDIPWGLAILLSIEDPATVEPILESMPHSDVFVSLTLVYLTFQLNRLLNTDIEFAGCTWASLPETISAMTTTLAELKENGYNGEIQLQGFAELFYKYKEYILEPETSDLTANETRSASSASSVDEFGDGDGWET